MYYDTSFFSDCRGEVFFGATLAFRAPCSAAIGFSFERETRTGMNCRMLEPGVGTQMEMDVGEVF